MGKTPEKKLRSCYEERLAAQRGVCAICSGSPNGRWNILCVDHDHATGRNRGLLCDSCNRGLGFLGDNVEEISRALNYLIQYRQLRAGKCATE